MEFKEDVLAKYTEEDGIENSVFICPQKLHFTLLMLSIDSGDLDKACKIITGCVEKYASEEVKDKIALSCQGLGVFPICKPDRASVLYTKLRSDSNGLNHLEKLSQRLGEAMLACGVIKDRNELKRNLTRNFHATLINSKYRRRKSSARSSLNVVDLIETMGSSFEFLPSDNIHVHLCALKGGGEYYVQEVSVALQTASV